MPNTRAIHAALLAALLLCTATIWIVPFLPQDSWSGSLTRLVFARYCHQIPARMIAVAGSLMPVCARCASIYTGLAAGLLLRLGGRAAAWLVVAGILATAVEFVGEWAGLPTGNLTRFGATVPLSFGLGASDGRLLRAPQARSPKWVGAGLGEGSTT